MNNSTAIEIIPKARKWSASTLVVAVIAAIVLIPLLVQTPAYPAISGDTNAHITAIQNLLKGDASGIGYWGTAIIGIPLAAIANLLGQKISTAFLWFNYLALIGIAITLLVTVSHFINKKAGILVALLALFCTQSIMKLFAWGTIFSIINMFIILPILLFFLTKWLVEGHWKYAIGTFLVTALFSVFHTTALYFPYTIGLFLLCYLGYLTFKKQYKLLVRTAPVGIALIATNIILSRLAIGNFSAFQALPLVAISIGTTATPIISNLLLFVTPAVLGILAISILGLIQYRKKIILSRETKMFLALLICFLPALLLGALGINGVGCAPRHLADFSVITAIIAGCLIGILLTQHKSKILTVTVLAIVAIGIVPTMATWFGVQGI